MANFNEVIQNSLVCLNMTEPDGHCVVTKLIELAVAQGLLSPTHLNEAIKAVMNREMSASTAMPDGIALPHGRTDCVDDIVCMIGIHPKGVDFAAPDNQPTHIIVLLLVPNAVGCNYIHFLANLSRRLMEMSVRNEMVAAATREQVLNAILSNSDEGSLS